MHRKPVEPRRGRSERRQELRRAPGDALQHREARPGQQITLGPTTTESCFLADHISSAVGGRVASGGMAVVFSGDTRFNPELIKASQGAPLLIHEAFRADEEKEHARNSGHSTAGEAARSAAQAGVAELVLTHLDSAFNTDPQPLIDGAKKHFNGPITAVSGP